MYALFEFVRLLTIKSRRDQQRSQSQQTQGSSCHINKFAWKEEGEVSFIALLCSNDYILLRYDSAGRPPIIKQLPWLHEKTIGFMCFDPTLTWLLIVTESTQEIFIIPGASFIDSGIMVNQIFKTDDATVRTFKVTSGIVTCAEWWQTLDGKQIAIIATNVGEIVFIDLLNEMELRERMIDGNITDLSLAHDDLQMNTSLLITTVTGNQWRLLLESHISYTSFSPDLEVSGMGYDNIDARTIPPRTIMDPSEENSTIFTPLQFQNFQPPTVLHPQYAKGHYFITAHCKLSSTLQVLDSDAEHSPLFVYKLPLGSENVILTDKLIFTLIDQSKGKKLVVLSNQKSENSVYEHQDFSTDAVVQEFNLPDGEHLIGIERKRYPFYYHEQHENECSKGMKSSSVSMPAKDFGLCSDMSVPDIPVTTHTVLDGCIVVTDSSVYEVRPCVSPERLFLHLALTLPDTTTAENLAISVGLDLTTLSELAAEHMLRQSCFSKALKLYTLSKCSATRRTGGLARHGCIAETMIHLRQVLSSSNFELNTSERKFLSNMLLHCFVYQMNSPGQVTANIHAGLSDFLLGSFSFDEQMALNLLSDFGEVELLLSFAKTRGLVVDALSSLIKSHAFSSIPFTALNDLVQRGFSAHLIQSGLGSLLPCLPPEDLVKLLVSRPQLAIQNCSLLKQLVPSLKYEQLLELARIFDPSKSVMRGNLLRLQSSRRRANSLTSLCSVTSEAADIFDSRDLCADSLIEFFLLVVLYLNHCRHQLPAYQLPALNFSSIISSPVDNVKDLIIEQPVSETHKKLSIQYQPVSCGPKHSAVVRNGDLYTWGRSQHGRLGHSEACQSVCPPLRVETLHILKLKVDAVACGNDHTLVLTQQGIYGWGGSKYGQVGVGTRHVYRRPMLLEALQSESIVAVECGHYHSLALTADQQVYSWGWGVHGQLGHGHPEDCLIPMHVRHLLNSRVMKLSAGYAHTLVLTDLGDVWSFGCGYFGQLGLGTNSKSSVPQKVNLPASAPIVAIGTKYFHSIAVSADDKVYQWGLHPHNLRQVASSLKFSKHTGVYIPEQTSFLVPALVEATFVHGKITKVCCGSLHSILLTEDGSLFIWGRNLEGQLGTGSRQDERTPKMLTSINDQHIVAVASGGEFNIAFDVDGSLWVWGKNDSGQLGYPKARKETQRNYRLSHSGISRASPVHGSEINTPSEMKGLPQSDVSNSHWMTLLTSLNDDSLWTDSIEQESQSVLDSLSDLADLGEEVYDSCVVPVTLKILESICETSICLQKCVDLEDWQTAGHISCIDENIVQALYYRLKFVADRTGKMEQGEIISICAKLIEHHIRLVQELTFEADVDKELQQLCSHALYCWQKFNFPADVLEAIFSEHLSQLAPWLSEVVLRQASEDQTSQGMSSPFSTHFSLRVLKVAMNLSATSAGSTKWGMDWHKMVKGANIDDSLLQRKAHLQHHGKLIPRDRLWTDILRNMKKEIGAITLTSSQLDHLSELDSTYGDSQNSAKVIVFTCGHHYTATTFNSEVMSMLNKELVGAKLTHSAALMKHILTQPGLKTSACPRCIVQGILDA